MRQVRFCGLGSITGLLRGSQAVPFCGSYLESYQVIPQRNYLGAYGYRWGFGCRIEASVVPDKGSRA